MGVRGAGAAGLAHEGRQRVGQDAAEVGVLLVGADDVRGGGEGELVLVRREDWDGGCGGGGGWRGGRGGRWSIVRHGRMCLGFNIYRIVMSGCLKTAGSDRS